jgi:tRNA dimethylallyltransferase
LNIGTAKPKYPHHLIDIVSLKDDFNVAMYKKLALESINKIIEKGKQPILVGGTGLYIKSIVENLDFPKVKPDLKLRKDLDSKSKEELFNIYRKLDKQGAEIIDKDNKRRLIRAIEVCILTQKPFSLQKSKQEPLFDVIQIGIKKTKQELKENIEKRKQIK